VVASCPPIGSRYVGNSTRVALPGPDHRLPV